MENSNVLIAQALSLLKSNIKKTGDPLGFSKPYWTGWADNMPFARSGESLLLTARMYQMLPFVMQTALLTESFRPMVKLLSSKVCRNFALMGYNISGEWLIRAKAAKSADARDIGTKANRSLQGIGAALNKVGMNPAYLYDKDPYSGVLLYDLGLENDIIPHMKKVYQLLKNSGAKEIITTDPHTTFMLKEIYPRHISHYDLSVRHYLEIIADRIEAIADKKSLNLPESMVIHDSCVMTRDLGIIQHARRVAEALGIRIQEPENSRENTACCGGPVEYAYPQLSARISGIRIKELEAVCRDILVACPICMLNLSKHERSENVRVWDIGEVLKALAPD